MDTLETLFSSQARVAILRVFLFQPNAKISASELAEAADVTSATARSHAQDLTTIKFLTETTLDDEATKSGTAAWRLNTDSPLRQPLHQIVLQHQSVTPEKIADRIAKTGNISLLILSGIFSTTPDRPVDILIVGDDIDETKLARTLTRTENQLGIELRYTVLTRAEFNYRHNLYDKLLRNVLDYPHRVLIDTMAITDTPTEK